MKSMMLGVIVIIVGLSILLGAVFGIHLPILKILAALFFIYLGLKILMGSFNWNLEMEKRSSDHEAIFAKAEFQHPNKKDAKEYVTVFGSSRLDLSAQEDLVGTSIQTVTVFGDSEVIVKKGLPLRIQTETVLGKAQLPGKNISAMGNFEYTTPGLRETDPAFELKLTVVFGSAKVSEQE